jgi:MFS transporter, OFA family, oxalate/formate antiporter
VPLANVLAVATGGWHTVFVVAALMNALAAIMALAVLKPLRSAHYAAIAGPEATVRLRT